MELDHLLTRRPVPGAGLLVTLTRRCPLSCAHCSTASTSDAEQLAAPLLRRFVGTYTADDHPEITFFTGGEPLLRPALLAELAATVRRNGGASAVLTGAFFARDGRVPARVLGALRAVDHVSVSLDPFHEREVPRAHALRLLRTLRDVGVAVSVHVTAPHTDPDYVTTVLAELRDTVGAGVPALVNQVQPVGRAAAWAGATQVVNGSGDGLPCAMAAWPVLAFDGLVTACCNQQVVDTRPVPDHLLLGDVAVDGWPQIRERTLGSPVLRSIRVAGPAELRRRTGGPAVAGYCAGCRRLGERAGLADAAAVLGRSAVVDTLVGAVQADLGAAALLRRYVGEPAR